MKLILPWNRFITRMKGLCMGRVPNHSMGKITRNVFGKKAQDGSSANPADAAKVSGGNRKNALEAGASKPQPSGGKSLGDHFEDSPRQKDGPEAIRASLKSKAEALDGTPLRKVTRNQRSNSMPNLGSSHAVGPSSRPLSRGSGPNGIHLPQGGADLDGLFRRYQALKDSSAHLMPPSMSSEQLDAELRQRLAALKNPPTQSGSGSAANGAPLPTAPQPPTLSQVTSVAASPGGSGGPDTPGSPYGSGGSPFGSGRLDGSISRVRTGVQDLDWFERQQLRDARTGHILGGTAIALGVAIGITQVVQAADDE
jgi:hypothetical protein